STREMNRSARSSMRDTVRVTSHGMALADIETPALLADLDVMDANIARMAALFRGTSIQLRPHFKNHKCIAIARRQMAAGAIGLTCATLQEAETLVDAGFENVLIANEIAGPAKMRRLRALAQRSEVIIAVDHPDSVQEMASIGT